MKYFINKIIVVEGKEDMSYLSSFIDAEFISLNGYDMPKEEIDYVNEASKVIGVLVLVDPDLAGRTIENKLKEKIKNATFLHVDISKCTRGRNDGVAECEREEIVKVLKPYILDKKEEKTPVLLENFTKIDFLDRGFRAFLANKFHLGKCNLKKLFIRINTLGITGPQIENAWREYYGN